MTTTRLCLAILVMPILLAACSQLVLRDRIDAMQGVALLGSSKGDQNNNAPIDVLWHIVQSPATLKLDKAAQGSGSMVRVGGRVTLQTVNHSVPNRYQVKWSGLRNSHAKEPTLITLRDNEGNRAVVLHFEEDRLRVITAGEEQYPRVHFTANAPHDVFITLSMTSRPTVQVEIRQGKLPLFTTPPRGMLDSNFRGLDTVDITVLSSETRYHLSNFSATKL